MTVITWDHSTFLAKRARESADLGPPKLPTHVALPGARAAVAHDRLVAYQQSGLAEDEIRERTNQRWAQDHDAAIQGHAEWVSGPYVQHIQQARERAAQEAAGALRRRALFDQFVAERDVEG